MNHLLRQAINTTDNPASLHACAHQRKWCVHPQFPMSPFAPHLGRASGPKGTPPLPVPGFAEAVLTLHLATRRIGASVIDLLLCRRLPAKAIRVEELARMSRN